MFNSIAILAAICGLIAPSSEAFSYGSGSCSAGRPAVGVEHLIGDPTTGITTVTNGTLAQGKIDLLLNGVALTPGVATPFLVGKDHNLTLASNDGYKGLLIRLGGAGTTALSTIPADTSLQFSVFCLGAKASGVSHTTNLVKKASTAILRYDTPANNLPVDVTVVVQNINGVSIFWYSSFILNAVSSISPVSSPTSPTSAPLSPTSKPVAPTSKPVSPTSKPVVPTAKPVAPTSKPVTPSSKPVTPTRKPVAPTRKPVVPTRKPAAPTRKPIVPTRKPIVPTRKPTAKPAAKPTVKPVNTPTKKPV